MTLPISAAIPKKPYRPELITRPNSTQSKPFKDRYKSNPARGIAIIKNQREDLLVLDWLSEFSGGMEAIKN